MSPAEKFTLYGDDLWFKYTNLVIYGNFWMNTLIKHFCILNNDLGISVFCSTLLGWAVLRSWALSTCSITLDLEGLLWPFDAGMSENSKSGFVLPFQRMDGQGNSRSGMSVQCFYGLQTVGIDYPSSTESWFWCVYSRKGGRAWRRSRLGWLTLIITPILFLVHVHCFSQCSKGGSQSLSVSPCE